MDIDRIAGVDLATYAWVVRQIAPFGYDQRLLAGIAQECGIDADDWRTARDGWSLRLDEPEVAERFRRLYASVGVRPVSPAPDSGSDADSDGRSDADTHVEPVDRSVTEG